MSEHFQNNEAYFLLLKERVLNALPKEAHSDFEEFITYVKSEREYAERDIARIKERGERLRTKKEHLHLTVLVKENKLKDLEKELEFTKECLNASKSELAEKLVRLLLPEVNIEKL